MRVYHQLVFNQFIEGATALYTDPAFNAQLALTEPVELYAIVDTVAGSSPTLTVQIEESPDSIHFSNHNVNPEINAATLSTSLNTTAIGRDPGSRLGTGFARLRVSIGGSSQKAHVRIWASGFRQDRDTPMTILGGSVLQWMRADLGIVLNGSTVSGWVDQSGNGNDYSQATAASQPAYALSGPNNLPGLTFDGSNDQLNCTALNLNPPATTPTYIWLVMKQVSWTSTDCLLGANTGTLGLRLIQSGVSPAVIQQDSSGVNSNNAGTVGSWFRWEAYFSNSTSDFLKIGANNVTGASAGTNAETGRQLGSHLNTGWSNIVVAELIYANALPTAAQRAWLDAYCTARYGTGLV